MAVTVDNLGKVRYNVRGEYSTSDTYTVDDIVTYYGAQYRCKANNAGSSNYYPSGYTAYWEKLSGLTCDKGRWSSATAYQVNDIVTYIHEYAYNSCWKYYDTSTWICKQANTNYNPTTNNGTQWQKLSDGSSFRRNAFLGAVNDGYTPPYKPLWNARCQSVLGTVNTLRLTGAGSGWLFTNTVEGKRGSPRSAMVRLIATGGGGSGFVGVGHINESGQFFQCDIIDPGSGYTSAPSISIDTSVSGYTGRSGGSNPSFAVYVTTNATNGATGTSALVGMGDSIGPVKSYGTAFDRYSYRYINRRHQIVNIGESNYRTGCIGMSGDGNDNMFSEGNFVNVDFLDGLLPTPDGEYPKIIQVESAGRNCLVLFNNGEVHYVGYNGNGQAGGNYTDTMRYPVRCGYANVNKSGNTTLRGKRAIRIAAAGGGDNNESHAQYALIENTNGTRDLYSWGYNGYGQLGHNDTTSRSNPTQIGFNPAAYGRIVEIWAHGGNYGTLYVLTDLGHLYACGYNGYGQLGEGSSSNRYTLQRVDPNSFGILSGSGQKIKKFSIGGGGTHQHNALVRGDGSAYTWGYNGYGNLGHNHTHNCYIPVRVRTSGYSGASNPVTSTSNQGTGQGTAFTDCVDYWALGGNSHVFSYMTRGSSLISNTCYAAGYNGYYNLSNSGNNTSNQSTFQGVRINNNASATNIMQVCSNQGNSSSYISVAVYRYSGTNETSGGYVRNFASRPYGNLGEWYFGGYDAGVSGRCHSDSYENRRDLDPDRANNNYRLKNNYFEPYANYGNWFHNQMGQSSAKGAYWVDLTNGVVFGTQNSSFGNSGNIGSVGDGNGMGSMRRPRHTHM